MKETVIKTIGILGSIIIMLIIIFTLSTKDNETWDNSSPLIDTSNLPPLNYFSSFEPRYFFYDPSVIDEDHPRVNKPSNNVTDIDDVFGPSSYFRYYGPNNVFHSEI